jgi:hypothetical protein
MGKTFLTEQQGPKKEPKVIDQKQKGPKEEPKPIVPKKEKRIL